MPTTFHARKAFNTLRPIDEEGQAALRGVKEGATVTIRMTQANARSVKHHRLFFSLVAVASEQAGWTKDQTLCWLKIAIGHADPLVSARTGEVTWCPRSIAFGACSQAEFHKIFSASIDAMLMRLLPEGTNREELESEIYARLGPNPADYEHA